MKNWKTSVAGIIAFAPQVLMAIGVAIPEPVSKLILAIFGIAGFLLAKDNDKTGV
jgi:uncharacterized membrane protein